MEYMFCMCTLAEEHLYLKIIAVNVFKILLIYSDSFVEFINLAQGHNILTDSGCVEKNVVGY